MPFLTKTPHPIPPLHGSLNLSPFLNRADCSGCLCQEVRPGGQLPGAARPVGSAQEADLAARAVGTSLLRMELLGEQRKAAQEAVGHPASPVVTASWQLPAVGVVSRPCEAGTWERLWPHRPVTVGQHTWECFFPMNTEHGGKLREFQAQVHPEERSFCGVHESFKPSPTNHSLSFPPWPCP